MLALEQLAIPNSHHFHLDASSLPTSTSYKPIPTEVDVEFDAELEDMENRPSLSRTGSGMNGVAIPNTPISLEVGAAQSGRQKAFALTIGLVIHSLADGLALGVSALAKSEVGSIASSVSIVVFLALLLHKGEYSTFSLRSCLLYEVQPIRGCLLPSICALYHFRLLSLSIQRFIHFRARPTQPEGLDWPQNQAPTSHVLQYNRTISN